MNSLFHRPPSDLSNLYPTLQYSTNFPLIFNFENQTGDKRIKTSKNHVPVNLLYTSSTLVVHRESDLSRFDAVDTLQYTCCAPVPYRAGNALSFVEMYQAVKSETMLKGVKKWHLLPLK